MEQSRVLVVEDEAVVAIELEERLAGMGYQPVGCADTGERALAMTRELRPDLILMDIRLKGTLDGIDAARQIRVQYHLPVIFLTAYAEDATLQRAKLAEPFGFISKPFDSRELKSTIELAIHKHRTEEEIRKLNRLYDVLSQVNQAIVHAVSREELLQATCRVAVTRGDVDHAWVGCLDSSTGRLVPVARFAGCGETREHETTFLRDGVSGGENCPAQCIADGAAVVSNACDAVSCSCLSGDVHPGLRSCGSFPLRFQGKVWGALNLCISEPEFFKEREVHLLTEVAMDISFALDKLESEEQKKRLTELLREQSTFSRTLLDTLPFPVFYKDTRFLYLGCNTAFERFVGVERDQIIGKPVYNVWPHALAAEHDRIDQAFLQCLAPAQYEGKVRCKDDNLYDVVIHKALFHNPDGSVGGIIGAMEDITERKKAEEALKRSEERYRSLVETSYDWIWETDAEGKYTFASPRVHQFLGYGPEEVIGRTPFDFMPESEASRVRTVFSEVIPERRALRGVVNVVLHRNGRQVILETSGAPVFGPDGGFLGYRGTNRDITESKFAERALRKSENRLSLALAASGMCVWEWDLRTNRIFWSPEWQGILPKESCDGTLQSFLKIVHPDDVDHLVKATRRALTEEKSYAEEFRIIRPSGETLWISHLGRAEYDEDGHPLRLVGIVQDITRRKEIEEERARSEVQVRQAQKMEALGTLAGGIAHDFNNILGIILGYTEMMLLEKNEGTEEYDRLDEVVRATLRARELVKQILTFSRRSEQEKRPTKLAPIVHEVMKMLRASLPATIEIQVEISSQAMVLADPTQIHQVLLNLCTNAAYSMRDRGGMLTVRLEEARQGKGITLREEGLHSRSYVVLSVADNGGGIAPDVIERIFDPFFTTKEPGAGTGLGLATVHGIVKSHGGTIEVDNYPGKGVSFRVRLPALDYGNGQEQSVHSPLPGGHERILIVDDEPALVLAAKQMLERLGYEVHFHTDGKTALDAFRSHVAREPFDLVITDMTMPHFTGVDLAGEIRKLQPRVPIILCTGFSDRIDAEKARNFGFQGFLLKPAVSKSLAEMVRKVLDERGSC